MADNIAVVRQLIDEVWNRGNLALCDALLTKNHVSHDPLAGEMNGIEAFQSYVSAMRTGFPDLIITADDLGAFGDEVFVRWTARGTHTGPLGVIPPSEAQGKVEGALLVRLLDGKISEAWYEWDTLTLFQSMGLLPKLDQLIAERQQAARAPQG